MMAPIALTSGDPAGVGLELSLKAWETLRDDIPFFLIADRSHVHGLNSQTPIVEISTPEMAASASREGMPLLHHSFPGTSTPGKLNPSNAQSVIEVIKRAVDLTSSGRASALCTNPINKKALKVGASFSFPGHTEFLAHLGDVDMSVMMLTAPELRVVPVTIHIALKEVPKALTQALMKRTIEITHDALIRDFGLTPPRIAVAGLNPHAGEEGEMGTEEQHMIKPLIETLHSEGMAITGPHAADTMFHAEMRDTYDVAVCMYHDQALIPLKTLNFSAGTNVTLGLPFIRTSPDHGTALSLAGKGTANPQSLIEALKQAHQMARARTKATQ